MAEYRTVKINFWNDPYIEELEAKAKLLYFYLFTGPYANNLGVVEATRRKIAYETSLTLAEVDRFLDGFRAAGKIVCDPEHNLIFLVNFIKHQSSTSPKILEGLQKLAPLIASTVIAEALYLRYPEVYGIPIKAGDTVSIPYAYGIHTLCIPSGEREREIGKGNLEEGIWKGEDGKGKLEGGVAEDVAAAPLDTPTPTFALPLADGTDFPVTHDLFATWESAYPLVDIRSELKRVKAWLISNPAKRPAKNMPRFVNTWMAKEQDERAKHEAKQTRGQPPPGRRFSQDKQQATVDAVNELLWEIEHEPTGIQN